MDFQQQRLLLSTYIVFILMYAACRFKAQEGSFQSHAADSLLKKQHSLDKLSDSGCSTSRPSISHFHVTYSTSVFEISLYMSVADDFLKSSSGQRENNIKTENQQKSLLSPDVSRKCI